MQADHPSDFDDSYSSLAAHLDESSATFNEAPNNFRLNYPALKRLFLFKIFKQTGGSKYDAKCTGFGLYVAKQSDYIRTYDRTLLDCACATTIPVNIPYHSDA